jgi:hypothetical protein
VRPIAGQEKYRCGLAAIYSRGRIVSASRD